MNDEDIAKTAALLTSYKPGFLPYPIFEQIARLVALPILEFIPLRTTEDGSVEVLLIARDADDALWPGMLHTPGTVIRATDVHSAEQTNWPAFSRILNDELKGTEVGRPHYVGSLLHKSKRGAEQAQLYWLEVTGQPKVGSFWKEANLPAGLMDSQRKFIKAAISSYKSYRKRQT